MSGVQGVSGERLSSLLGHVTHRGFDDLVDPKNQGIAYPTGNPDLLITGDPLFYTNLLATLDMFRLNSASLTFSTTDEGNQFRRKQKLTRTKFSFKCTRENPMPKHRWESYLRQVKAMVVDHFVRSIRHQSKNLPKHYEVLFTGSEVPTGPTELSQVQRDKRKLGTMCHALIADHMFTPNLDAYTGDDAIIDTFTQEDSARATRSNSRGDKLLLNRKKAEWRRHLATVRSTLSDIFLWFIREVSTTEIQQDFEQVFRSHILQNQAAGGGLVDPFNADILIAHIKSNYVTDNSDSITAMERRFETMVRWRSETIVQWIDRFEAPLAELEVARDGLAAYTEDELSYLWKQTFADNISGEEIQIITTHMPRYVDANSLQDVQDYLDGTFDTQLFSCALISLASSPVAMSQTSVLCKPIAIASSASNCCRYLASPSMTPPHCPLPKRNRNGSHLQLRPRIGLTKSESSPAKRLHQLPSLRLSHKTSSAKGLGVLVGGPPSLIHTLNAFIKLPRKRRYLLRPIFWPIRRNHLLTQKPKRQTVPTGKPLTSGAIRSKLHLVPLRHYLERTSVKLIAIRAEKKDITLVIALATPRGNPFCPKTNHFDRY